MADPNIPLKLKDGSKIRRGKKTKITNIIVKTCSEDVSVNNKAQEIAQSKSNVRIWYESRMFKSEKKRGKIHKKAIFQIRWNSKNANYEP